MKKYFLYPALAFLLFISACTKQDQEMGKVSIIPAPVQMTVHPGFIRFDQDTRILFSGTDEKFIQTALLFSSWLNELTDLPFPVFESGKSRRNSIFLALDSTLLEKLGKEGYEFHSGNNRVVIKAASPAGIFYGLQTLYQLLPPEVSAGVMHTDEWKIPLVDITDYPQFSWRGMHLDVSRHFFPVEFIKKYIDLIAMHKMNVFHWHLTDDNGWRIEIKKYPLLTDIAAWHVDRESRPWDERELQQPGEKATYGGYYTQEEIREIVDFASERFITVIPEIEMPGHSSEVFAAYPEYSCTGQTLTVQPGSYWPNTDIFCAGKEGTFEFLENILQEVAGLFPSEYIHIGGDEADKTRWKACPFCQERIRNEGLKNEDELQSYFIRRIEKSLTRMGKNLIGWDEILEGGLAPRATVMSWRGYEGGIDAARQGHDVIMCPTNYCYFDYYQADPEFQPEAIGGLTTLKKVYSFQPVPSELDEREARHILGGQGNVWTEYIPTPRKVEYMALPRMTALAEVLWSPDSTRDWNSFRSRLQDQFERFDVLGVKYCEGSGKVEIASSYDTASSTYSIALETETPGTDIYYTNGVVEPDDHSTNYSGPITIIKDENIKAIAYLNGKRLEKPAEYTIAFHRAIGSRVSYREPYSERYPAGGLNTLADGLTGSANYNDGLWQGFNGNNLDLVMELPESVELSSISCRFLQDQKKWIFMPEKVNYFISEDGTNYNEIGFIDDSIPAKREGTLINNFEFGMPSPVTAKFIRVQAVNIGKCPDWHPGKGGKAWIFADEIIVK